MNNINKKDRIFQYPIVEDALKKNRNINFGRDLSAQNSRNDIFFINNKLMVKISEVSCNCNVFKDSGIPCRNLCAAFLNRNIDPFAFVTLYFSTEKYFETYSPNIMPLSAAGLNNDNFRPPEERRSRVFQEYQCSEWL